MFSKQPSVIWIVLGSYMDSLRKWFLLAIVILLLGGALFVIAVRLYEIKKSPGPEKDKVYLRITSLWGGMGVPPDRRFLNPQSMADRLVYDRFLELNPDVEFRRSRTIRLQGPANESAVLMAQAGRTAGNILYVNFRTIDNFVMQRFLAPLDNDVLEYVRQAVQERNSREESDPIRIPEPLTLDAVNPAWIGLHPMIWQTIHRHGPDGKKHVYAWPYSQLALSLRYRRDLFRQKAEALRAAGLDPNRAPRTWEELLAYTYHLTDPDEGIYGLQFVHSGWWCVDLLWQAGARVIVMDEEGNTSLRWNVEPSVQAIRFHRKLLNQLKQGSPDPETGEVRLQPITCDLLGPQPVDRFIEGTVAMTISYSAENQYIPAGPLDPSLIGIAPLPAGPVQLRMDVDRETLFDLYGYLEGRVRWVRLPNGSETPLSALVNPDTDGDGQGDGWRIRAAEINAPMFAVNAVGTTEQERQAAWRFLTFYGSDEAHRIRTRVFVEAGQSVTLPPVYLERFGYEEYLDGVDPTWVEANRDVFASGRPEPNGKNCQHIYKFVFPSFEYFAYVDPRAAVKSNAEVLAGEEPDLRWDVGGADDRKEILAFLDRDVAQTRRRMLNEISPEEAARSERRAWWLVGAVFLGLTLGGYFVIRSMRAQSAGLLLATGEPCTIRTHLKAWSFMAVAVVSILLWRYYPLVRGAAIAFEEYSIVEGGRYVGLKNFVEVLNAPLFWKSLLNSFLYVGLCLGLGFFLPIFLAIALDEIPVGSMFFRIIYYLPAVMSGLVVAFVWKWMYDPTEDGFLNSLLIRLHLVNPHHPVRWLADQRYAMVSVVIPTIWTGIGPGCIIYLAALKSIPEAMYEAADVDGAGPLYKIRHITIPYLWPLVIINFVGAFIGAFKSWQNIFVMTAGGPLYSTHVVGMEVWYNAFAYLKFGYATAVAWIIGALLIGFTLTQLRILRNVRFTVAKRD